MSATVDFTSTRQNGVYLVDEVDLDTLDAAAHAEGHLVRRVSLAGCGGKHDLLHRIATTLAFPDTFGANWDALADCLADLEWLPQATGYVWLFDHADDLRAAAERDFDTFCDILGAACEQWQARTLPCFAFLAMPDDTFHDTAATC